jgi:hypothetical protein
MRLHWDPVKLSPKTAPTKGFYARWLEGWELALPAVGIALLSLLVSLPQPTLPEYLPLPTFAPEALDTARGRLVADANAAKRNRLPFSIRSVGEHFRQIGRRIHLGYGLSLDAQTRYQALVRSVLLDEGPEQLRQLRAIQTELFVAALNEYERTGSANDDLTELGGEVLDVFEEKNLARPFTLTPRKESAQTKPVQAKPERTRIHVLLGTDERRAVFLLRWTELSGLNDVPELRLEPTWVILALGRRLRPPLAKLGASELKVIDRISEVDPTYPTAVAKGLLFARLGAYEAASLNFSDFLAQNPNAPYSHRAKNHLVYVHQFLK